MRATRKEKDIQRAIVEFLAKVPGVYVFKTGGGMFPMTYKGKRRMVRMGHRGVSDLVGWVAICVCDEFCVAGTYCGKPTHYAARFARGRIATLKRKDACRA